MKTEAVAIYMQGISNVENNKEPKGQKFPRGSRVRIVDDLGGHMSHFPSGCDATVMYTYAHAYGGNDVTRYCLSLDGIGEVSWYEEWQLTALDS